MSSETKTGEDWEWREWEADFSVPDEVTWNRMVVNDLCGGKSVPDKANGTVILNELLLDIFRWLNTPGLVKYLVNRCLLTEGETWALTEKPLGPQEKTLHLQQILMKKGDNPLIIFYQCLLESYGLEQGLAGHYTLVQIIKRKVRFHDCSDMGELLRRESLDKDPAEVVRRIKAVPIPSETARRLIQKLNLEEYNMNIGNVTTQDIAECWLATEKTRDWTVLVEALLTERGCGCSVSGVLPLSVSNPPEVWHFVRRLNKEWTHFANFLGFPRRLICDIKSAWMRDTGTQIKSFMRVCLIPDCGDEKIRAIIQQIAPHMPVSQCPSFSAKDLAMLSHINPSEDEKEDLPSGVRTVNSWSAQGGMVVFQLKDFLKVIEQQKHTEATPLGYRGGATPGAGNRSNLCSDDEIASFGDNSAEYGSDYDASNATMTSQEMARESDVKLRGMKTSEPTRQQSLGVPSASEDNSGRDILQACVQGAWEFVKQNVTSASNLAAKNKNGRTALHVCCIKGNTEVVKVLLQHGADVPTVDNEGNNCLHFQETLKNEVLVEVLVKEFKEKDIPLDQLNKNDLTPLMVACLTNSDLCINSIDHLITNGAAIDGPPDLYSTPLIHASAGGNKRIVNILIMYGANVNKQDQEGSTALIQSCLCSHTDIAVILLEAEADVNRAEKSGTTALAAAITRNSYELVRRLLEKSADPNAIRVITSGFASGQVEETPLAFACAHGLRDIAQLLIIQGAKVNFMCSGQVPAIGFAIIGRQQETVEFMLQVEEFNKSLYGLAIPMHIAMNVNNLEAAKAVLDVLGGPQKALELALQKNHHQFIQDVSLFIEVGGDTQGISQGQPTTRSFASESRNQRVKVEQTLQTFCQICMSAITADRDHEVIIELATADDVPHVAVFFRDYFNKPHRADILKANFLSRDQGISPLNFSIERGILNSEDFQVHAFEYFPEGPDQFYTDLVWVFHQISGGEDLSWDVTSVLQRLFSGSFSLNVQSTMADARVQAQNFPETNHVSRPISNSSRATAFSGVTTSTTTPQPSTLSNSTSGQYARIEPPPHERHDGLTGSASCHIPAQGFDDEKFSETNHTPRPISKSSRATNIKPGVNISTTMSQPLPLSSTTSGAASDHIPVQRYGEENLSETDHTPRPISNHFRATSIEPCVTTASQPSTLSNSPSETASGHIPVQDYGKENVQRVTSPVTIAADNHPYLEPVDSVVCSQSSLDPGSSEWKSVPFSKQSSIQASNTESADAKPKSSSSLNKTPKRHKSRIPIRTVLQRHSSEPQPCKSEVDSELQPHVYTPSPKTEKRLYFSTPEPQLQNGKKRPDLHRQNSYHSKVPATYQTKQQNPNGTPQRHGSHIPHSHSKPKPSSKPSRQAVSSAPRAQSMYTRSPRKNNSFDTLSPQAQKQVNTVVVPDDLRPIHTHLMICGFKIPNKSISDPGDMFQVLSSSKKLKWCSLARLLFLTKEDIKQIKCFRKEERCYQMLCFWKIRFGEQATYSTLAQALLHSHHADILKEFIEVFNDDM